LINSSGITDAFYKMIHSKTIPFLLLLSITLLTLGCESQKKEAIVTDGYFEGEISLAESRGLYGSLFKVYTTYTLAENRIKREQKLGGINSVFGNYAGMIVDLEKDRVILYYSDKISDTKIKHSTTVKEFRNNPKYQSFPNGIPSPVDHTFELLPDYSLMKQINDSAKVEGYRCDYTLFNDESHILKQEIFDTKEIKVKRELLEMVFFAIPENINFPLRSDIRTTLSDINNDSLINSPQSKALELFLRDAFKTDTTAQKEISNKEENSTNKWINLGLEILKKGVDMNIHITSEVDQLKSGKLSLDTFSFPSSDFREIDDFDDFIGSLPSEGSGDFDD